MERRKVAYEENSLSGTPVTPRLVLFVPSPSVPMDERVHQASLAHRGHFVHHFIMVTRSKIRAFSQAIARKFRPRKIVLFGSYAYGTPTESSDVDLMVIMPRTRDRGQQMSVPIPRDFPLDLLLRTPADVAKRLRWKDPFICDVLEKGKVLYEANHA